MELIYIGGEFYRKSKTMMSSLYNVDGSRSDWGFVDIALEKGESVNIRPATSIEMKIYIEKLKDIMI